MRITLFEVEALSLAALSKSGANPQQAGPVAVSVREAEAEGLRNVGLGYLPIYCEHLRCGKVRGDAKPHVVETATAVLSVDAGHGFCHPAFLLALPRFVEMAESNGIAALAIAHSYSAGVVGWFVKQLAERGLVALAFANSPAAIAPWGGSKPMFGTNPIGFAAPRADGPPVVVDMASSATARVNITQAAARGEKVPLGWVLDADGKPTTEPKALLSGGSVAPSGGAKGFALALMVDILAGGLTGAHWSHESSPFANNEGGPPGVGQLFIGIAPRLTGGAKLAKRLTGLARLVTAQPGARLPGDRRHANRQSTARDGVDVPDELLIRLEGYAGGKSWRSTE